MLGLFIEPAQLTPVYLFYLITPNAPLFWDDRPAQVCTSVGVTDSQIGGEAERQTLNTESVICFGLIRSIGFSLKGFSVGRQYFSVISTFCQVAESARPMLFISLFCLPFACSCCARIHLPLPHVHAFTQPANRAQVGHPVGCGSLDRE